MAPRRIPLTAARRIAKDYGYEQVVIYARHPGPEGDGMEHITTYGVTKAHCDVAAAIGNAIKRLAGWK